MGKKKKIWNCVSSVILILMSSLHIQNCVQENSGRYQQYAFFHVISVMYVCLYVFLRFNIAII